MKHRLKFLIAALVASLSMSACGTIKPTSSSSQILDILKITADETEFMVGETSQLYIEFPQEVTDHRVKYESADTDIAQVNTSGLVLGIAEGVVKIIVTSIASSNIRSSIELSIISNEANQLDIESDYTSLLVDSTLQLSATFYPDGCLSQEVVWSSSNKDIATVDQNGLVKGLADGFVEIYCSSLENTELTDKIGLSVVGVYVQEIITNVNKTEIEVDEQVSLATSVNPSSASDKKVLFTISDNTVISYENGVVKGLKAGTSTIKFASNDGHAKKDVTFTVKEKIIPPTPIVIPVTDINVSLDSESSVTSKDLVAGEESGLYVSFVPSDATDKSFNVSIDNNCVKYESGILKAISKGTSVVTVTSNYDSSIKKTVTINVSAKPLPEVSEIVLNEEETTLDTSERSSLQLSVSYIPAGSSVPANQLTWYSSSDAIATVSSTGLVTAVGNGDVTITVQVNGKPTVKDTCLIHVTNSIPVTGVSLDAHLLDMNVGDSETLTYVISPSDATNKNVTFSSSNQKVATVDATGLVNAIGNGSATITVTTVDGVKTDECVVNVTTPVNDIYLSQSSIAIYTGSTSELSVYFDPDTTSNKAVTWTSEDEDTVAISVIDESKVSLIALKASASPIGIKCTSDEDSSIYKYCYVTVVDVSATSVVISSEKNVIYFGETAKININIAPEQAKSNAYEYIVSEPGKVAIINDEISPLATGTVTIKVKMLDENEVTSNTLTFELRKYVTSVDIDEKEDDVTLYTPNFDPSKPSTVSLHATLNKGDIAPTDTRVSWSSNDESIATVDQNGVVTAVSAGNVNIVCTSVENNTIYDTCPVTVKQASPLPVGVQITSAGDVHNIDYGDNLTLTSIVLPEGAPQDVTWTTSDDSILSISSTGATCEVTGVGIGTAYVRVETPNSKFNDYTITVSTVSELVLTVDESNMLIGGTSGVLLNGQPFDATLASLYTLVSSNAGVVSIVDGTSLSGDAQGSSYIYVIENLTKRTSNSVLVNVGNLSLSETEIDMYHNLNTDEEDYEHVIKAFLSGSILFTNVTWSSNNEAVVTIDADGVLTPHKAGSATITCRSVSNPSVFVTASVTVKQLVTSIEFESSSSIIKAGSTSTPTVVINPNDATNKEYILVSDNPFVVKVDNVNHTITGVSVGTANITVKAVNYSGYQIEGTVKLAVTVSKGDNPIEYISTQTWDTTYKTEAQNFVAAEATKAEGAVTYTIASQPTGDYFSIVNHEITMKANTPVGTYEVVIRASASGTANYEAGYADSTLTITVAKAVNPINCIEEQSWTVGYSTVNQVAQFVSPTKAEGSLTYSIISQDGDHFVIQDNVIYLKANTAIGTYSLVIGVNASGNDSYLPGEGTITLTVTVEKGVNPITYTNTNKSTTYNPSGIAIEVSPATNEAGDVSYQVTSVMLNEVDCTSSFVINVTGTAIASNANLPAGTYTVKLTATAVGNDLYKQGSVVSTFSLTINKAANTVSFSGNQNAQTVFSTVDQTTSLTAAINAVGTVAYKITSSTSYFAVNGLTLTVKANTPVGSYQFTYEATAAGNDNYLEGSVSCTVNVTVNKGVNPIQVTSPQTWEPKYSTSSSSTTITGATGAAGTVSYAIQSQTAGGSNVSYFSISGLTVTAAAGTPINNYVVVIRATAAGDSTYASGYKDITLNVKFKSAVTSITVNASSTTIQCGGSTTVSVTVLPEDAGSKEYELSTDNTKVFSLSGNTVNAIGAGKAKIIATAKDGSGVSGYVEITSTPVTTAPSLAQVKAGYTWNMQDKNAEFKNEAQTKINGDNTDVNKMSDASAKATMQASSEFGNNAIRLYSTAAGTNFVYTCLGTGNLDCSGNFMIEFNLTYYCKSDAALLMIRLADGTAIETGKVVGGVNGAIMTLSYAGLWKSNYVSLFIYTTSANAFEIYVGKASVKQTAVKAETKYTSAQLLAGTQIWDMTTNNENIDGIYGNAVSYYGDSTMTSAVTGAGYQNTLPVRGNASHIFSGLDTSNVLVSSDPTIKYSLYFKIVFYASSATAYSAFNVILNGSTGVSLNWKTLGNNLYEVTCTSSTAGFTAFNIYANSNPQFNVYVVAIFAKLIEQGTKITLYNNGGSSDIDKKNANLGLAGDPQDYDHFGINSSSKSYDISYYNDAGLNKFENGKTYTITVKYYCAGTNGGALYLHVLGAPSATQFNALNTAAGPVREDTFTIEGGHITEIRWHAPQNQYSGEVYIISMVAYEA